MRAAIPSATASIAPSSETSRSHDNVGGATVTNGDGILLHGNTLYVVRNRNNEIAVIDAIASTEQASGPVRLLLLNRDPEAEELLDRAGRHRSSLAAAGRHRAVEGSTAPATDGQAVHGASILLLGVTYKANIADQRESPATPLARHLMSLGAQLSYDRRRETRDARAEEDGSQ